MSRYDIRGMQASGMTQQQINDYIKQQDTKIYGPKGMGPKGLPVKPQVMPPVKPRPIRTATGTPIKSLTSSAALRKFAPLLQQMKGQKPNSIGIGAPSIQDKIRTGTAPSLGSAGSGQFASGVPEEVRQNLMRLKDQGGIKDTTIMKKGGGAKKYEKGGKINLDACSVSTASKSKKSPNW
jgi:hypothetical protein